MSPEEAPNGTIVVIGHPANCRIAKKVAGSWYLMVPLGNRIDPEELRLGGVLK